MAYVLLFFSLPIVLLSASTNIVSERVLIENVRKDSMVNIELIDKNTSLLMDTIRNMLALVAVNKDICQWENDPAAVHQELELLTHELQTQYSYLEGIALMDSSCRIFNVTNLDQERLQYFYNLTFLKEIQAAFFNRALDTFDIIQCQKYYDDSQTVLTKMHTGYRINSDSTKDINPFYGFSIVTPIYDGSILTGYLSFVINTSIYSSIYQVLDTQKENLFYILDNHDYRVVSAKEENEIAKNFYGISNISQINLKPGMSQVVDYKDSKFIVTTKYSDVSNYILALLIPYEYITNIINTGMQSFVQITIFCLFLSIVVSFLISQFVYRPVFRLKSTIERYRKGNHTARCTIHTLDEFGELSKELNHLLDTIHALLRQVANEERLKQSYRYQLIQSQVNPHFLYNIFEMINSFIRLDLRDKALEVTSKVAKFYRISLSDGINIISVKDEVSLLQNYLDLQQMRYIEFMKFTTEFDSSIFSAKIPKLILQPIAENAIYHGLRNCGHFGELHFRGYSENNWIVFECTDNGCGIAPEKLVQLNHWTPSNSERDFGTSSIFHRLNHYFDGHFELCFESEQAKFTRVTIKIPMNFKDPSDRSRR